MRLCIVCGHLRIKSLLVTVSHHVESLLLRSHGTLKKPFYVCNLGGHDAAVASEIDKKGKSAIMTEVFSKKMHHLITNEEETLLSLSQSFKENLFCLGPKGTVPIINSSFIIDFI